MFNIVLYEPEIPPNTGNIIRLCANTGTQLHLIHPLGFRLDEKSLRRAGLDYHEFASINEHENFENFVRKFPNARLFAFSTKGKKYYSDTQFQENDFFIFGPESRGLPQNILSQFPQDKILKIPMTPNNRSLNLSNTAAIALYEAWRQLEFCTKNT